MGKNKPRHNPDKPQNNKSFPCPYFESDNKGNKWCEGGFSRAAYTCEGNPHNCVKAQYHRAASTKEGRRDYLTR